MTFRKLMKKTHLWLGIPVSLIIAWVALSGALLALQDDIRRYVLYPSPTYTIPPNAHLLSPHQLRARLLQQVSPSELSANTSKRRATAPTTTGIPTTLTAVEYRGKGEAAVFTIGNPQGEKGATYYFLNPYTGDLLARYSTANDVFNTILLGHRYLWLPQSIGRPVVGITTLLFIVLILSGIVMWLPKQIKKATLKHALSLSLKGGKATVTKRWHGTLGLYLAIFGLLFTLTGLTWSFAWYRNAYNTAWGLNTPHALPAQSDTTHTTLANDSLRLSQLFVHLCTQLPIGQEGNTTFTFAQRPTDPYTVTYHPNYYSVAEKDERHFDRYTLRPLATTLHSDKPLNERIAGSPYDLHTGSILGRTGRILYFTAAIAIASLPITGIWIVVQRKRKKKKTKR